MRRVKREQEVMDDIKNREGTTKLVSREYPLPGTSTLTFFGSTLNLRYGLVPFWFQRRSKDINEGVSEI
ncbi:hypothetical protein M0802_002318 [Mischocyttarus mexicanus]|nr:hypothetical protein M0802_002318 [Mischocyttarus mexicanus]